MELIWEKLDVTEMEKKVKTFAKTMETVDKDSKVSLAYKQLKDRNTHLVVVDEGEPLGIVSWKDLLWNMWDEARKGKTEKVEPSNLYVSSIATRKLVTTGEEERIQNAAKKMIENDISSLPVERNGKIVSILTKRSLLKNITLLPNGKINSLVTNEVITASEGTSIHTAIFKMKREDISMLPIVEKGNLTGFVDVHGLAREMVKILIKNPPYKHIDTVVQRITLSDIMKGSFGLPINSTIYEFAKKVVRRGVKGTPILPEEGSNKLLGILSETDICRYISQL